MVAAGLISDSETGAALGEANLNRVMSLNKAQRIKLRHELSNLLAADSDVDQSKLTLVAQNDATMLMPCHIGDYTDFYASVYHATNVGSMFRPNNPLLPNYKHIPIGYHGRASSIVASGAAFRRPVGQKAPAEEGAGPTRSPSALLDYEFEVGFFVAEGNELGSAISIDEVEDKIFGMVLLNDWSARDLQKWEYQPLGPFLAKSFVTTIAPWVVTMEALAPFRCAEFSRPDGDPKPLDYLTNERNQKSGGVNIQLEAFLTTSRMREQSSDPFPPVSYTHLTLPTIYSV